MTRAEATGRVLALITEHVEEPARSLLITAVHRMVAAILADALSSVGVPDDSTPDGGGPETA
jgi:hypothetical protein